MKHNFKSSLKVKKIPSISYNSQTESLLQDLGLFPLPENVQVNLSRDNKYIELKLKPEKNNNNGNEETINHIAFQMPLQEDDLSALQSRTDYQDLFNRYYTYTNEYIEEIKKYALQERAYLQEKFPGLIFNIKIRAKSLESYLNKLNQNILEGKSPYIDDIIAERIIITEYKNCRSERVLSTMCDKVAKALYDFRIDTNFRMKQDVQNNNAATDKEYVSKDYIEHPKENGYKSLHILMENKKNSDLKYETQIRTFEMEHLSKTSNEIAHNKYKPRILNDLSVTRVPMYSVITPFNDSFENPIILDASFENRFYHFYNTSTNNHQIDENSRSMPITYENYKKEMHEIESILGLTFRDLRTRLRTIDTDKYVQKNKERCD